MTTKERTDFAASRAAEWDDMQRPAILDVEVEAWKRGERFEAECRAAWADGTIRRDDTLD